MQKYKTPIMEIKELAISESIAFTLSETPDNEAEWLDGWTSGILN